MEIRDKIQEEAKQAFIDSDGRSILCICPRVGKTYIATGLLLHYRPKYVVIAIPRNDITREWTNAFSIMGYTPDEFNRVRFTTFASLNKLVDEKPDMVIIDEIHEASPKQRKEIMSLSKDAITLGLTGTMTQKTESELLTDCDLAVCYRYTIEQGVNDGILSDYQITIHKVPLDNIAKLYKTKKGIRTEKNYFDTLEFLKGEAKGMNKHFFELKQINILQKSEAKYLKTIQLIKDSGDKRVLVFCGLTEICDRLGIPAYHSKSNEKQLFEDFCNGKGNKLCTIKMMQAGITVRPISMGVLNYISGSPETAAQIICRFLGYEYNNPNKIAELHIVSSNEKMEEGRLKTALSMFSQDKITTICA